MIDVNVANFLPAGRNELITRQPEIIEGGDLPVLVEIPARVESYFSDGATAGPAQPFLVSDAFISTPQVTIPGWTLQRCS